MIFDLWHRHAICTWLHIQKWYNHVSLRDFAPCFNLGGSGCSAWAVHGWETSESCFGCFANEEMLQFFSYLWFPVAVCTKTWNILEWPEVRTGTSTTNTMSLHTLYFHYLVFCVFWGGPGVYVVVTSTKPAPGCEETHVDSDRERDIKSNVWLVWPTLLCSNCWTSAAPVHVDMVRDMVLSINKGDRPTDGTRTVGCADRGWMRAMRTRFSRRRWGMQEVWQWIQWIQWMGREISFGETLVRQEIRAEARGT